LPTPNQYKPIKNPESANGQSSGFLEQSQVTDSEVLLMIMDGKTDSQIVKALWGLVPSRSEDYKNAIKHIERLRLKS
jgi:putative SOS response-associated peptidase YedK